MFVVQPQQSPKKSKSTLQNKLADLLEGAYRYKRGIKMYFAMFIISMLMEGIRTLMPDDSRVIVLFDAQEVLGTQWMIFGLTISVFSILYTFLEKDLAYVEGKEGAGEIEMRQQREIFRLTVLDMEDFVCLLMVNSSILVFETAVLNLWDLSTNGMALVFVDTTLLYSLWIMFQLVHDIRKRTRTRRVQAEILNERIKDNMVNSGGGAGETVVDHTKYDNKDEPTPREQQCITEQHDGLERGMGGHDQNDE